MTSEANLRPLKKPAAILEELEGAGNAWGAALVPASAQARPVHSLEEDSFKT